MAGPDARKTLPVLREEWSDCTRCTLGDHRNEVGGRIVFGVGRPRGILFVGDGPGVNEERTGEPFVGRSGKILRRFIEHFRIKIYYITNLVLCRSCVVDVDEAGNPRMSRGWGSHAPTVRYKDQPPNKAQMDACAERLYEEIYLVDPLLIVALGQPAAAALRGSSIKITKERGIPEEVQLPGAGYRASFSSKKKEWRRKVKGEVVMPTVQSSVRYMMIPTLHPAYVVGDLHNESHGNPFDALAQDIRLAKRLYDRYNLEVYGQLPEAYEEEVPDDLRAELRGDFDEEQRES